MTSESWHSRRQFLQWARSLGSGLLLSGIAAIRSSGRRPESNSRGRITRRKRSRPQKTSCESMAS